MHSLNPTAYIYSINNLKWSFVYLISSNFDQGVYSGWPVWSRLAVVRSKEKWVLIKHGDEPVVFFKWWVTLERVEHFRALSSCFLPFHKCLPCQFATSNSSLTLLSLLLEWNYLPETHVFESFASFPEDNDENSRWQKIFSGAMDTWKRSTMEGIFYHQNQGLD